METIAASCTKARAHAFDLTGISDEVRDVVIAGTDLADASTDYAVQFNIPHAERPRVF